ncbi:hypothetical protein Emag_004288 [Eimeria magna]
MAKFGHVFLIPSDGHQAPPHEETSEIWGATAPAAVEEQKDFVSYMSSLSLGSKKQHQQHPHPPPPPPCVPPAKAIAAAAPSAVEANSSSGRSGEAFFKSRRLPNVEHLLLAGVNGMQQLLQFRQSNNSQQTSRRQEGLAQQQLLGKITGSGFSERRATHHHGENAVAPVKGTGRGVRHTDNRTVAARGSSSLLGDGHLALQSALVTVLHLQQQGNPQRKPVVFPKRNLLCLTFLRLGLCPSRDTCNYAHNLDELQKKLELRKTSLCKYWMKGKCENEDCSFAHGEDELQSTAGVFKTTICKYWRQGCCHSGQLCRHAHGEADLRPENLPPHLKRKKLLQQQCRMFGRTCIPKKVVVEGGQGVEGSNVDWEGHAGAAALDYLYLMLRDGVPLNVEAASPHLAATGPAGENMLTGLIGAKHRWHTGQSNSSELSSDVLASSASSSPRGVPSSTSVGSMSSSSGLSLSPEHSFSSAIGAGFGGGGLGGGALPPPATSTSRSTNAFGLLQEETPTPSYIQDLQQSPSNQSPLLEQTSNTHVPPPPGLMIGSKGENGLSHPILQL